MATESVEPVVVPPPASSGPEEDDTTAVPTTTTTSSPTAIADDASSATSKDHQQQRTVSTASPDSDNEEDGHAMELALLQEMIHDREKRMKHIERTTTKLENKLERCRVHLSETEMKANEARTEANHVLHTFKQRIIKSSKYLGELEANVRKSSGSLDNEKEYDKMIKNMNKQRCSEDEVYDFVRKSQSQLCKAMHAMGILEHQLEIIKDHSESLIKSFKEKLNGLLEEKSMVELKMMNQLMSEDQERKQLQAKVDSLDKQHLTQLDVWQQSMTSLRQLQLAAHQHDDQKEEESDYDSEEEIDEDLLREIIDERKEDVQELESLAKTQQQQIQELQDRLAELNRIS